MASESILSTVKKLLSLDPDYDAFDLDIVTYINTVIAQLHQLGLDDKDDFKITGAAETWDDYVEDPKLQSMAKSYMYVKIKPMFDPPSNSFLVDSLEKMATEMEWRITVMVDSLKEGKTNE